MVLHLAGRNVRFWGYCWRSEDSAGLRQRKMEVYWVAISIVLRVAHYFIHIWYEAGGVIKLEGWLGK